jgi:putative Ca2+/H+ antiporter (TMEM165/GDT1 family)
MTMAGQYHNYFAVWAGSTIGMFVADLIAVICGRILGKRMPEKIMKYGSAIIFIGAGIYTLVEAFH